ncbi:MAG: hypothetical protein GYB65_15140, partial [Chloroflexi bacterium]|nr:hypothetical protein [Chloroflexota bacterium]
QMREHFPDVSARDIIKFGIHDLTPGYVAEMRAQVPDIDPRAIVQFGIHDITADYVVEMRSDMAERGYGDLGAKELIAMYLHDFDPGYVDLMREQGYEDVSLRLLVKMWAHTIDAHYLDTLREQGRTDLSPRELINLRRAERRDVEWRIGDLKDDLRDLGFRRVTTGQIMDLIALGVDLRAIKEARLEDPAISLNAIIMRHRRAGAGRDLEMDLDIDLDIDDDSVVEAQIDADVDDDDEE